MIGYLVQTEAFLKSNFAILVSIAVFLVSHFLCSMQGMGRKKVGKVMKSIEKASRELSSFESGVRSSNLARESARKLLLSSRMRVHSAQSVLNVYLFEGEDNPTIRQAMKKLQLVEKKCEEVAVNYNEKDDEELLDVLADMKRELSQVLIMLQEVKNGFDEKRKKVI